VSIKKKFATAVATAGLLAGLFGSAFVPAVRAAVTTDNLTPSGADNASGDDVTIASGAYVTYTIGAELGATTYSLSGAGNCTFGTGLNAGTMNLVTGVTVSSTSIVASAGAIVTGTTFTVTGSTVGACVLSATEGADTANTSYDITVVAAAQAGVPSVAKSKLYETYSTPVAASATGPVGAVASASATDAAVAAADGAAWLTFLPKDAYDAATANTTDVTATASGPCLIGSVALDSTVGALAKTVNFTGLVRGTAGGAAPTLNAIVVKVVTDGTGGGTCSVAFTAAKDAGTKILIATGSVVFYGTATTVTLEVDQAACINTASACTGAISFTAKDANGNRSALTLAHGTDFTLTADDGSAGATLTANTATTSSAAGTVTPTCTTDQEKLTITVNKTGYTSNSVSFYCSKVVASSVTASWGGTVAAAGSLQTLTISAFDDLGYPVAYQLDGSVDFTITVNATAYGTVPTSFDTDLDGVLTVKYIMPSAVGGTVSALVLLGGSATTPAKADLADAIEATTVTASVTVSATGVAPTISVGPKKLTASASFGAAAASKKITFVIENAAGKVRTYYRKANASGVATFTIKLRGTWDVYASYGDDITELGKLVRK
jgi:hypothetical protein